MNRLAKPPTQSWLDASLYPFRHQMFGHEDGNMHYIDEGAGAPLLFVHGTPSWSFEWRRAILMLRERYRCIAPDHLGFGLSDKPVHDRLLPRDHTNRLGCLISALDLRDVTLVVHDFGGPIATPLVVRDGSRFRRVVIANTWAWPMDHDRRGRLLMRLVRSPLGRLMYSAFNASPRWLVPASFADPRRLTAHVHRHYLGPFNDRHSRRAPWTLGAHLVDSNAFAPELRDVMHTLRRVPTSIIWGREDRMIAASVLAEWQRLLPHAPVSTLSDAGHFPQEECPEAFFAALQRGLGV
jgi:pimeloyl-ACP methyl ester carboxylesterase